ncbi:hypothetical protein [Yoonia sp. BS5-3]|uniref:Uncharacterized protein n=1 Tax=Yoonia phaeophyticola TaxID=3137369 RepID=A0ABZ2VC93_9RHOB
MSEETYRLLRVLIAFLTLIAMIAIFVSDRNRGNVTENDAAHVQQHPFFDVSVNHMRVAQADG